MLSQKTLNRFGRLRTTPNPVLYAVHVEPKLNRFLPRIIVAYNFNEAARIRAFFLNNHYTIVRFLLGTHPGQTNHQQAVSSSIC
jgi:hypothetical protein